MTRITIQSRSSTSCLINSKRNIEKMRSQAAHLMILQMIALIAVVPICLLCLHKKTNSSKSTIKNTNDLKSLLIYLEFFIIKALVHINPIAGPRIDIEELYLLNKIIKNSLFILIWKVYSIRESLYQFAQGNFQG